MADLLDSIEKMAVHEFKKDFVEIIRVALGMDKYYGDSKVDISKHLEDYESLIKRFNDKYPGLFLKVVRTSEDLKLKILIKNVKNIQEVFSNAAKITGIKSIGLESFGEVDIDNPQLAATLEKAKDRLYISYYDADKGSNTIFIEYSEKDKMIEVMYEKSDMIDDKSPEFKLCAFYAVKEGYDQSIGLTEHWAKFGFLDYLESTEKNKWLDRFQPDFTE